MSTSSRFVPLKEWVKTMEKTYSDVVATQPFRSLFAATTAVGELASGLVSIFHSSGIYMVSDVLVSID